LGSFLNTFFFEKISKKLEQGKHRYSTPKKVLISKHLSTNKKVVLLSSLYDVVIQKAFCCVLQQIYEGVSVWQSVDSDVFKAFKNDESSAGLVSKRFSKNKNTYEVKK
jgi:hypothetical protein